MKKVLSVFTVLLLVATLLLTACSKNIIVSVFRPSGDTLSSKSVKLTELSAEAVLQELKNFQVVPDSITVNSFESNGSDSFRRVVLDLGGGFRNWLSTQDGNTQKLTVQAVANTFLHCFSADTFSLRDDGQLVNTGVFDFSAEIFYVHEGVWVQEMSLGSSSPLPTIIPEGSPTVRPSSTAGTQYTPQSTGATPKPTPTGPLATPQRDDGKKYVAITFDDGPHSKYTTMIVDKLKEYNASATFFVVGNRINENLGKAIKYVTDNGSEIAIHGYTHEVYYNSCSEERYVEELEKTRLVIEQYTGIKPTMMRPIGGSITSARVASCPYAVIMWNVDSEDWKHKKASQAEIDAIVKNVMDNVRDGSIVLLHEIYENSYQAFCIIMEKLTEQGYKVVSVTELLGKNNVRPGVKFFSAK